MKFKKILASLLSAFIAAQSISAAAYAETSFGSERDFSELCGLEKPFAIELSKEEMDERCRLVEEDYAKSGSFETKKYAFYDFTTDYFYNQLNTVEKKFYNDLDAACKTFISSNVDLSTESNGHMCSGITYDSSITTERMINIYHAFYYSNPQYFFLANGISYYPGGYRMSPIVIRNSDKNFLLDSTRDSYETKINTVTNEWLAEINKCSTDLEKETLIAQKLCDNIVYTSSGIDQSLAAALVDKQCVCNGYAMAFTYFCNAVDIEAIAVASDTHAWNRVKLYDKWYEVDTTWMDTTINGYYNNNFFNLSHSTILNNDGGSNHDIQYSYYDGIFTLPDCATDGVTVPNPVTPSNIKLTAGDGKITVSWDKVSGASRYAVATYLNGKYTNRSTSITGNSYTITGLTNGTSYGVLVMANVNGVWSSNNTSLLKYATPKASTLPATPSNIKLTVGDGKITVSWDKVSGASRYAVATYLNGKYTNRSTSITGNSYTITGLTNGTSYGVLVMANVNGVWSSNNTSLLKYATPKASTLPATPSNIKLTAGNGKITVSWDKVSGASRYAVATYLNGKYTNRSTTITGNSYTITGLTNGTSYGVLVMANVNGVWSSNNTSLLKYATPKASTLPATPSNIKLTAGDGKITVSWDKVSGASRYAVATYLNGKYTNRSTTITGNSYTITGLTNGTSYGVLVMANVNGVWSSNNISLLKYATPVSSATAVTPSNIKLTAA